MGYWSWRWLGVKCEHLSSEHREHGVDVLVTSPSEMRGDSNWVSNSEEGITTTEPQQQVSSVWWQHSAYPGYLEQSCLLGHIVPSVVGLGIFPCVLCPQSSAFSKAGQQWPRPVHKAIEAAQSMLTSHEVRYTVKTASFLSWTKRGENHKECGELGSWESLCQALGLLLYSGQARGGWRYWRYLRVYNVHLVQSILIYRT